MRGGGAAQFTGGRISEGLPAGGEKEGSRWCVIAIGPRLLQAAVY